MTPKQEAKAILDIFAFYRADSNLYKWQDDEKVDELFEAIIAAINDCGELKPLLPFNEFVRPSREYAHGDKGWVGHFEADKDNKRFFLSDVVDYLTLYMRGSFS